MTQTPPDPVLAGYRKSIDNIDAALIHMLAERFRIDLPTLDRAARDFGLPGAARPHWGR